MAIQKKSVMGGRKNTKNKNSAGSKGPRGSKVGSAKSIANPTKMVNLKPVAGPNPSESVTFPYTKIEMTYTP